MDRSALVALDGSNEVPAGEEIGGVVGNCPAMRHLARQVRKLALSNLPVIIQGESGTGKEALARALHTYGPRRRQAYVTFNCSELVSSLASDQLFGHQRGAFTGADRAVAGLFEQADGGTLFLDEFAELPLELQAKLLRVLESGELRPLGGGASRRCDVRVVVASHVDLREAVAQGRFRNDLYQRLRGVTLRVPALRDRAGDRSVLIDHFLAVAAQRGPTPVLTPDARAALEQHPLPGNVRELKMALERAFTMADNLRAITVADLDLDPIEPGEHHSPSAARQDDDPDWVYLPGKDQSTVIGEVKRKSVARHAGNVAAAARELGVHRSQMYRPD